MAKRRVTIYIVILLGFLLYRLFAACAAEADGAPNDRYKQLIARKDGQEYVGNLKWVGKVIDNTFLSPFSSFSETTAATHLGVLHLFGIPLPIGIWLSESDALDFSISDNQINVKAVGREYPVIQTDISKIKLEIETLQGNIWLPVKDVKYVHTIQTGKSSEDGIVVSLIMKSNEAHLIQCTKIQFVRYPERIWEGSLYIRDLGPWHWYVYDDIIIKSGDSTIKVQLNSIKKVRVSGSYPSWDIEFESIAGSPIIKGNIAPAERAAQNSITGGVSSWNREREGFWFRSAGKRSYLFIPIANIKEINVLSNEVPKRQKLRKTGP